MNGIIRRKVFFATALAPNSLTGHFDQILRNYDLVLDVADAEFIIFDLSHPPRRWAPYIARDEARVQQIERNALIPCFFLEVRGCCSAMPPSANLIQTIIEQARNNFISPRAQRGRFRISNNQPDLLEDIEFIESMIPFFKMSEEMAKQVRIYASALNRFGGGV